MKKRLIVLLLSLLGVFLFMTPTVYEAVDGPYEYTVTAYGHNTSSSFTIDAGLTVSFSYYGKAGGGWYVKLKRGSETIYQSTTFDSISTSNGYYTEGYGSESIYLNPGQYYIEASSGSSNNYYSTSITATVWFMKCGKSISYGNITNQPFRTRINTPVYYRWSGYDVGWVTKYASFTIKDVYGNIIVSGGRSASSGSFITSKDMTYYITCDGGYTEDQYHNRTHHSVSLQLLYDDTPLEDQISVSVANATRNPDNGILYTHNPVTINWTNQVKGGANSNRTYRIIDTQYGGIPSTINLKTGGHDIYIQARDDYGNTVNSPIFSFYVDDNPPQLGSVSINTDNATNPVKTTNNPLLTMYFPAAADGESGLYQIRFSESNTFSDSGWININGRTSLPYPLTTAYVDGEKIIYTWIKDNAGNITGPVSSDSSKIIYDTHKPTNCSASVNYSSPGLNFVSKDGVTYVAYKNPTDPKPVQLNLSGLDNLTGVISTGPDLAERILPWDLSLYKYATTLPWDIGTENKLKTATIYFKDGAGNQADPVPLAVILDTTAPTGGINITANSSIYSNNGLLYTNNPCVILTLQADDGSGVGVGSKSLNLYNLYEGMSDGDINDNNWVDYGSTVVWDLVGGQSRNDGPIRVCAVFRDLLGNVQNQRSSKTIILDRTRPSGDLAIQGADGRVLDTTHPSNSPKVSLSFSNLADNDGFNGYNSGLKGIEIWDDMNTTHTFIPATSFNNGSYTKSWTIGTSETPVPEGNHEIQVRVVDNVGNEKYIHKYFNYDTTPPNPVPLTSITRQQFDPLKGDPVPALQLVFAWEAGIPFEDTQSFKIRYTLPNRVPSDWFVVNPALRTDEVTQAVIGKKGSFSVPITGVGPNQPVIIEVIALDEALNPSSPAIFTGYTDAALGDLQFVGADYNPVTTHHQLKWQVDVNPGESQSQAIQLGKVVGDVFQVLGEATADSQGNILLENLYNGQTIEAHSSDYSYRLIAYNNGGDVNSGAVVKLTEVPNLPPTKPVPQTPVGFARPDTQFVYRPAVEPDGDPGMTQTIYIAKGDNPAKDAYIESSQWTEKFIHGQTYTWKVIASDQRGGTIESNPASFTVDDVKPTVSASRPDRVYTNQTGIAFTAGDDLSGVTAVTYKMIDAKTEQVIKTETMNITGPNRTVTGTIPLIEGNYHLHLQATDVAGNISEVCQINNLIVDRTAPALQPSLMVNLPQFNGKYVSGSLEISLKKMNATDNLSGIGSIDYWFVKDKTTPLDPNQAASIGVMRDRLADNQYGFKVNGDSGQEYYLALCIIDRAGNQSGISYVGPILLDLNPPVVSLKVEGMNQYGAGNYVADLETLQVTVNATSQGDPASFYTQLAIVDSDTGNPVSGWGEIWDEISGTSLNPGGKYRILARVRNQLTQRVTEKLTPEFIFDNTSPEITSITGPTGMIGPGEEVVLQIAAADPESGIKEYRLALRLDAMQISYLTPEFPENQDGWITIRPGVNPTEIRMELPDGVTGSYYPMVQAINAAGLSGTKTGSSFTIANNQEKISVRDQGPYSMFDDHLTGTWKYLGAQAITGYRYRILGPDQQPVTDWQITSEGNGTVSGLTLESGKQYRFEVQAKFEEGYSESNYSPGVTIDTTKPVIRKLIVPEYTTSEKLGITWEGADPESGIGLVQAALGSDFYGTDITGGWVTINGHSSGLAVDAQGNPLKLETGKRYYLTLRLVNAAGLATEAAANGIMIDDTPPPTPLVLDQGWCINTKQPLEANWLWSVEDPESGPDTYQWALLEDTNDLNTAVWHDGASGKRVKLTELLQRHGHTYYFAVKATNQLGLNSVGISDGILADETAPYISEVKLLDAINLANSSVQESPEINYITQTTGLNLWINSVDTETQVTRYQYAWGTWENVTGQEPRLSETALIPLDNLDNPKFQMSEGVVTFFTGQSENEVGLVSTLGYSGGVILDTSSPRIGVVHGGASGTSLLFDWELQESKSPVAFYEIQLVAPEDVHSVPNNMQNMGLQRSHIFSGVPDGKYQLLVRATNLAGTSSRRNADTDEWGISPVVMLDTTPPEVRGFYYDRYADNQLKFQVTAVDNLSGIRSYQYAIGSITDPYRYSGGWIDVEQPFENLTQLIETAQIPHNSEVYLMVRVKDNAGLWSKPALSGKIIIDHTKPELPAVVSGKYTNLKNEIEGINITAKDPESSITNYRISLVTNPGAEWITSQILPVDGFEGKIMGLNLVEAGVYYLAVQAQNGTGAWSDTGYSGPITVDTIPPELRFPDEDRTIVINHPPLSVKYTLSEDATVELNLVDGALKAHPFIMAGKAGTNEFIFGEDIPATYKLYGQATDPAHNPGNEAGPQTIRVNAPPQVTLPVEINTTPGQPIVFSATVTDPDGKEGERFTYKWILADERDPGKKIILTGATPEFQYTILGDYTVSLTVTDQDGGEATSATIVKVRNTTRGRLYLDEVWSGIHRIYGDVTVPAGIKLTIQTGTQIIIDGILGDTNYFNGLIIKGQLEVQPGVVFDAVNRDTGEGLITDFGDGSGDDGWKGITIEGNASFNGVTFRHAFRALAVFSTANVTVTDCTFRDNYVAVHVYGSAPQVYSSQFINNLWYGIKEDLSGRPVVIDCGFSGNEVDYYQDQVTEITIDQLNRIPGNRGNHDQD
ncbi:MAG TPA: PKD domain-containing protein [Bacillota bacterium]|nr:PKD domain-containing protein [Bacillota bacterium]